MQHQKKFDLKKFSLKSGMAKALAVLAIVFLIFYIVLILCIENADSLDFLADYGFWYYVFDASAQVSLLLFSVTATAVVSNWIIEVNRSNDTFADIICNDFLASDKFYNTLSETKRKIMLKNLEKNFYFNGKAPVESMYRSIRKKLNNESNIYYESCTFDIECEITDTHICRKIVRTTALKSCNGNKTVTSLPLASTTFKPSETLSENSLLKSAFIDGTKIPPKHIKSVKRDVSETVQKKNGYSHTVDHTYTTSVTLTPSTAKKVKVEYTTFSPATDIVYVARLRYPCKNFSFTFKLTGTNIHNYELSAHSFGFKEEAEEAGNSENRTSINLKFNDWIFPQDGIAIVICPKNNA